MAKIAFLELEGWEEPYIRKSLIGHDLILERRSLTPALLEELEDIEVLSVFIYSKIGEKELEKMPRLRAVVTRSTGFDHIDLEACRKRGVAVFNVPAYGISTVAEFTILLMLMLMRRVRDLERAMEKPRFSPVEVRGRELAGKTLGVIGTGRIGSYVAKLAKAFGMNVIAYDIRENEELKRDYGVRYVDLDTLLSSSDIVTLHLPLTPETEHILNRENIRKLKRGAVIVNTARGGLIETEALVEALEEGIIAGAALDVVEGEWALREGAEAMRKLQTVKPEELRKGVLAQLLTRYPNVIITPHVAYNTWEALHRILETTLETIKGFLEGKELSNRVA